MVQWTVIYSCSFSSNFLFQGVHDEQLAYIITSNHSFLIGASQWTFRARVTLIKSSQEQLFYSLMQHLYVWKEENFELVFLNIWKNLSSGRRRNCFNFLQCKQQFLWSAESQHYTNKHLNQV